MEDLNDMKIIWQNLNDRLVHLENENKMLMHKVMMSDYQTAQEKLKNKYIKFIIIESVMILFITWFLLSNPQVNGKYRIVTLIYWCVFFLAEIILDLYLLKKLKDIDIYSFSLKEVAIRAASNWKLHKIGILFGFPFAIGAVFLFALAVNANEFTIYGMLFGAFIGLIIGFSQLSKLRKYYKFLQVNDE